MPTLDALHTMPANYDEGDFVVMEDVPVFKEHQTREMCGADGNVILESVWIGESDLEAIVERCNERIEDTGDYATIVLRHTDDSGERDPKVVGFAGPYKMGVVGNKNPLAAILATFRIFKDCYDEAKRYPRRSVEFWADQSDPRKGYFDPISLLGAEAPELDLGIRYGKNESNAVLVRYSKTIDDPTGKARYQATAPGGTNTFIPSGTGSEDKKQNYQKESTDMAMSPDDIRQIVEALKPTIQEVVLQSIAEALSAPGDATEGDTGMDSPAGDDAGVNPTDPSVPPPAMPPETPPAPDAGVAVGAAPAGEPDGDEEKPVKYGADMADKADDDKSPVVAKYRKEAADYKVQYQKEVSARKKAEQERDSYKAIVDSAVAEKQKAVRYQKLQELAADGICFELEAEAAEVTDLSDEQFDKHVNRMLTRYQRVPMGMLHTLPAKKMTGDTAPLSAKYAKKAADNVEAARRAKKPIEYASELSRLCAENPDGY